MEKSLYFQYVDKYFPQLVLSVVERLNEQRRTSLPYMYKDLLEPVYSADGRWSSILAEYTRVAADVVSLDSELPLKSRDAIETAHGEIPKMGMKLYMTEKQMKDLYAMIAQQQPLTRILQNMFADVPRVIEGIWERLEDLFLSELSSGVGITAGNNGTGVRIDVGFKNDNKFGVAVVWRNNLSTSTPLDDIQKIFDKAMEDNNLITDVYADDTWLQGFYQSNQVRAQYAFDMGISASQNNVPILDLEKASQVLQRKWGITLHRVARKVKTEINGRRQNHSPWATGVATFVCDPILGSLVWTNTVESTNPVAGVTYETADEFILVSRYSTNDPLREFTSSQAMVLPVINNVDRIYTLDSTQVQA